MGNICEGLPTQSSGPLSRCPPHRHPSSHGLQHPPPSHYTMPIPYPPESAVFRANTLFPPPNSQCSSFTELVLRGRPERSARAVQLFGRVAVLEAYTLGYYGHGYVAILIFSPSIGDHRQGRGYVAILPTYGPPRRHV